MTVEQQCAIIFAGTNGMIMNVPISKVKEFEVEYLSVLEAKYKEVLNSLKIGKLTDEVVETLTKVIKEVSANYGK